MQKFKERSFIRNVWVLSSIILLGVSWSAVDVTLNGEKIEVKNNTADGLETTIRFFMKDGQKGPHGGYPFEKTGSSGKWNGLNYEEWFFNGTKGLPIFLANEFSFIPGGWGYKSGESINSFEVLVKDGACSEPTPRCDADPISLGELKSLMQTKEYYSAEYRYAGGDFLGKNGGKYAANFWDSFCGETQFQFARPLEDFKVNLTSVSLDDKKWDGGPMVWMALSGNQEYYGYDLQYMIAKGAKETFFMTGQPIVDEGIKIPMQAVNDGSGYTPFEIEPPSFGDLALTYPKVYPHGNLAATYVGPGGLGNKALVSSAWMVNGVFGSGTFLAALYEQLSRSTDLAWKQLLENSWSGGDKYIGLCQMSALYNRGPIEQSILSQLLPKAKGGKLEDLLDNPDACSEMIAGFGDYINQITSVVEVLEKASRDAETNKSIEIIDYWITKEHLSRYWFGEGGSPSTSPAAMQGGLLKQYDLTQSKRQELWDETAAAFEIQSGKWPKQNGKAVISLRYDWLSNIRVVKSLIDRNLGTFSSDFKINSGINKFSEGKTDANGQRIDKTFPFMERASKAIVEVDGSATLVVKAQDSLYNPGADQWDRGVESVEWSFNDDWSVFSSQGASTKPVTGTIKSGEWEIKFPKDIVEQVETGVLPNTVWLRVSDSCGNKLIKKVSLDLTGRPIPPKINSAWILDTDGDGKGDQIHVEGSDNLPDSNAMDWDAYDSVSYSWPEPSDSYILAKSEVKVSGKNFEINNSELKSSTDKLQGSVSLFYYEGATLGTQISKDGISDSIGPVIRFASIKDKMTSNEEDSLRINFSRGIEGFDFEVMYNYFIFNSGISDTPTKIVKQDENRYIFIYPANTITAGDSIKIDPGKGSTLTATFNSRAPADNNQKVEIILDKGVVPISEIGNEFLDSDVDGRLDQIQLVMGRPVDGSRLAQMDIEFSWLKNEYENLEDTLHFSFKADLCTSIDGVTLTCDLSDTSKIAPMMTYFEEGSWGELWLTQPDFDASTGYTKEAVNMRDGMGPVLKSAFLKKVSNPDQNDERMLVEFTEPLSKDLSTGNQLFDYQIEKNVESFVHGTDFIWLKANSSLRYNIEPGMNRAGIGDKIRIRSVAGETSLLQDLAGNTAHSQNPWVLIGGKQILQFFFNEAASISGESYKEIENFGSPLFFEKSDNVNEHLTENELLGFGVSFSFKDSSLSVEDRKKVKVNYKILIYDQLGQFVVNKSDEFGCEEIEEYMKKQNPASDLVDACNPAFVGASRQIRAFVPWNFRSFKGRLVGSGVYLMGVEAYTQNEESKLYPSEAIEVKIGVIR